MALQTSVGYPGIAFPGQHAAFAQQAYTPENYLSDGTVKPGCFAFAVETDDTDSDPAKVAFLYASLTGEGTPVGLVERTFTGLPEGDGDVYGKGDELTIAIRGDFYIEAAADAEIGQAVLCDPSTGEVTFGTAGDTNDTGWTVSKAGAAGDMIIVSNHG